MKLELKKFDPTKIKNDSVVVFIGKRNTGKSYCMKDILSYNKDIPVGVVVSPTEKANGYFEKFIPKMLIYDDLEEKLISKYLNRQINITNNRKRELAKHGSSTIDPRSFLILDDCMYNKSIMSDKNIRCIFMNGRHYKIFLLITMQHGLGLPLTYVLILIMYLYLEITSLRSVKKYTIIMLVCFLHLMYLIKL